jgi:hypothetical protein
MLAGMSHNYPSDFYVTTATVIPVLYLAIAVQGPAYQNMLKAAHRTNLRSMLLIDAALLILAAAVFGEVIALVTLYSGSDILGLRIYVLVSTLLLLLAAAAGPTTTFAHVAVDFVTEALSPSARSREPGETDTE